MSQKLIAQYTGSYSVAAPEHYLPEGTPASHVFDLEHARTGRKLDGVNITRFHRFTAEEQTSYSKNPQFHRCKSLQARLARLFD